MRIVVWNVCGRAAHKLDALRELQPDVAVVPECEETISWDARQMAWNGAPGGKGLAVLTFGDYTVRKYDDPVLDELRVMPVTIGGPEPFRLLAVWADNDRTTIRAREEGEPMGPVRRALRRHERWLRKGPTVVAGDFNHNAIWDRPLDASNHSYAVADLASLELSSAYHRARGCAHGSEEEPTFFLSKSEAKRYHIDFCFVPDAWAVDEVRVSPYERYCRKVADGGISDHAPLEVDVSTIE